MKSKSTLDGKRPVDIQTISTLKASQNLIREVAPRICDQTRRGRVATRRWVRRSRSGIKEII